MSTKSKYLFLFVLLSSILAACAAPAPAPTAVPVVVSTSTPVPVPTTSAIDPVAIAQGFWDAVNSHDIDEAMTFVADDVECRGGCYFTGRDMFNSFMLSTMKYGKVEISDLKVISEDTITYTWKIYNASGDLSASGLDQKFQVDQDGKIIMIQFP